MYCARPLRIHIFATLFRIHFIPSTSPYLVLVPCPPPRTTDTTQPRSSARFPYPQMPTCPPRRSHIRVAPPLQNTPDTPSSSAPNPPSAPRRTRNPPPIPRRNPLQIPPPRSAASSARAAAVRARVPSRFRLRVSGCGSGCTISSVTLLLSRRRRVP
ncbi:hypothetical protein K523DRAFT_139593 [Schizophyllum commune Tattone D]|nr:hypothetical protein K523DRAFT_139593 [Schizophyllum commune Tattone D]